MALGQVCSKYCHLMWNLPQVLLSYVEIFLALEVQRAGPFLSFFEGAGGVGTPNK